jgi:hypothetical protein
MPAQKVAHYVFELVEVDDEVLAVSNTPAVSNSSRPFLNIRGGTCPLVFLVVCGSRNRPATMHGSTAAPHVKRETSRIRNSFSNGVV